MYCTICFSTACSTTCLGYKCVCLLIFSKMCVILCEPPCNWQGSQTDRLGCISAISSAWLPERFFFVPRFRPSASSPYYPASVVASRARDIFFTLSSCPVKVGPLPGLTPATVPWLWQQYLMDLPSALRKPRASVWQREVEMPEMAASVLCPWMSVSHESISDVVAASGILYIQIR